MSSPGSGAGRGPKADRAVDAIRAAATDLIVAAGDTSALTMDALVERTGLDADVVALCFPDTDALLHDLILSAFQRCLARMDLEVSLLPSGATAIEDLEALAVGYVVWADEDPSGYALAFGVRNTSDLGLASLEDGATAPAQVLDTVIAGVELCRPDLPPDVAKERAVGLWLTLHGLVRIRVDRPKVELVPTRHLIHTVVDVFAGGPGRSLRVIR